MASDKMQTTFSGVAQELKRVGQAIDAMPTDVVEYDTTQSLTDTQKAKARTNIGAGTSNFSGSYNDLSDQPSIPANNANPTAILPSAALTNGFYYVSSTTQSLSGADSNPFVQYHTSAKDFRILTTAHSSNWIQQIATDFRTDHIYYRRRENGTWTDWTEIARVTQIPTFTWDATNHILTINDPS